MKKKILAIAMTAIVAALGLTGCNNGMGINDDGTYTWKMALNSTEGDNAYDTGAAFAKKIEELTDGRVEVVLYGGGSLGTTSEVLEGMKFGVANVMCESIGTLATFTPMANIDATPYLFRDYASWKHGTAMSARKSRRLSVRKAALSCWAAHTEVPVS